jgi:hypothetical protein
MVQPISAKTIIVKDRFCIWHFSSILNQLPFALATYVSFADSIPKALYKEQGLF